MKKPLQKVASDQNIPEINRMAVICFMTTFDASSEYWNSNSEVWLKLVGKPATSTRVRIEINFREIAFADAWWGYQGLLSSGLNPYVGGGAAAAGSVFACLR